MPPAIQLQPRIIAIWAIAALIALVVGAAALGAVTRASAPGVALSLIPRNGFAYQAAAIRTAEAKDGSLAHPGWAVAEAERARNALRREPLANTAASIVALAEATRGDAKDARALFELVNRMSRREPLANRWLTANAGRGTDERAALRLIDDALRVNPALSAQYMPALARALAQPGTLPFFRTALADRPDWEDSFWNAAAADPAALPNAVELRLGERGKAASVSRIDRALAKALVDAGQFELAMRFAARIAPVDRSAGLVRNPEFRGDMLLPPLDWEPMTDGRFGATVDPMAGTLEMDAVQGAGGIVARQLLELPPGDYVLSAKLGAARLGSDAEIVFHLRCATGGSGEAPLIERMDGDLDVRFHVAAGGCVYRWLEIEFSGMNASAPVTAMLADVRIVPHRRMD